MEQVRRAAAVTMEGSTSTPQQVSSDYMMYRAAPLSNTFLNFIDDSHLVRRRRSRSIPSLLSAATVSGCVPPEQEPCVKAGIASTAPTSSECECMLEDAGTNSDVASTGIP
eukprot:2027882-Amphidinium_carterae.1